MGVRNRVRVHRRVEIAADLIGMLAGDDTKLCQGSTPTHLGGLHCRAVGSRGQQPLLGWCKAAGLLHDEPAGGIPRGTQCVGPRAGGLHMEGGEATHK